MLAKHERSIIHPPLQKYFKEKKLRMGGTWSKLYIFIGYKLDILSL